MVNTGLPVPIDRILEEARLKIAIAKEHLNDLSTFGINQQWINQFQKEIDTAVSLPIFEKQLSDLKQLTTTKDEKLSECVEWGQKLRLRMTLATKEKKLTNVNFPSKHWTEAQRNESKLISRVSSSQSGLTEGIENSDHVVIVHGSPLSFLAKATLEGSLLIKSIESQSS